jgi:hypothetical protein
MRCIHQDLLKEIIDAGAKVRVLDRAYIDFTSPIGRGFMAFMSAMAGATIYRA